MTVTAEKVEQPAASGTGNTIVLPAILKIQQPGTFPAADYAPWKGLAFPVYCISVESYLDVYLQLNGDETNRVLDLTSEHVQSTQQNGASEPFAKTVGMPCLAYFDVDQFWYRAKIVRDHGDGIYDVYFVDYGNTMKLSEKSIIACPSSLISYVEGITKVALNGFTGDETEQEVKILQDLVESKNFLAKIDCVEFEIKGKHRMLLSLFDFETGVPLKTQIEQALKAQRDADRTPLEKQAWTEDVPVQAESTKGSDAAMETPVATVACDDFLTAQESCPLEELEDQERKTNFSALGKDDSLANTNIDETAMEPRVQRSLESVFSSLAASAVYEFSPSFNAADSSEQNASPTTVNVKIAVVPAQSKKEEPEVAVNQPVSVMTEDTFDGHLADYLRTAPVIRSPSAVSPSSVCSVKTNVSPDEHNNGFVDAQLPWTESGLEAKQEQVDSLTIQLKAISDELSELKKEKESWNIVEKELTMLRKEVETLIKEHERNLGEMSAKLHETLVAKSCALHNVSKLQEELTVKTEKLEQVEIDMENLKIEDAKRAQRKQIEMTHVINECRLKMEQLEKDKTAECNRALLELKVTLDDNAKQLKESHAVEVNQLQLQLQESEKNFKELEKENLKMRSEKAQMDKINMGLQSNLEEKQAELSQQCHDELEKLRKENAELHYQNRQLLIIKENLERQLEEKSAAFEHSRERHGSGSVSELLSPRSVPGAGSFDFEARVLMQKGVIRRLGETLDAVVKLYTEESHSIPSRPKTKTLTASIDPCQLAQSFQMD